MAEVTIPKEKMNYTIDLLITMVTDEIAEETGKMCIRDRSDTGIVVDSTEKVLKKVEEDKNAVGYVAYSSATDTNGKILQINRCV